jgi:hypothetical protein
MDMADGVKPVPGASSVVAPQRAATAARAASESLWSLSDDDPARAMRARKRTPRGYVAMSLPILGTAGVGGSIAGVVLTDSGFGGLRSRIGPALGLGFMGALLGVIVGAGAGGIVGYNKQGFFRETFPKGIYENPNYNQKEWLHVASKSLVGHSVDGLASTGLAVERVVKVFDSEQLAVEALVTKDAVDAVMNGESSGRAVVQLPAFSVETGYALVDLAPAPNARPYPAISDSFRSYGKEPVAIATLKPEYQNRVRSVTRGNEKWMIHEEAAAAVLAEINTAPDHVMGEGTWRKIRESFDGYVTSGDKP